jgi:hypothetical protein
MKSRLAFACLLASAAAALIIGCGKYGGTPVPTPAPSPSSSVSPAPDTLYVQTTGTKQIRAYKGASADNSFTFASEVLPTNDITQADVVYDPASDTLWYPSAYPYPTPGGQVNTPIELWTAASTKNNLPPDASVPFTNGEGAAAYDGTHKLLFVATTNGPQVSVYPNPQTMTTSSTPAAIITMQITDGASGATPRPQEMLYDPAMDNLFVSDQVSVIAIFKGFGSAANAAVMSHTNPTIAASNYCQGLASPDGLAYAPPPTDMLWVGEQLSPQGQILAIPSASACNGPIGHVNTITGFNRPGALAFDGTHGSNAWLFVYDVSQIDVIPNALIASGNVGGIAGLHVFFDGQVALSGFGMALDTTH